MAITNKERVGRALDILREGLYPFVEREMRSAYNEHWENHALSRLREDRNLKRTTAERLQEDITDLINVIFGEWHDVFKKTLGNAERNLVGELKTVRDNWAHGKNFSTDDAYRALDSTSRLLSSISAPQADTVEKQKQELLRLRFEEQARWEKRRATNIAIESNPQGGLKPWREIVTPHDDVASAQFKAEEEERQRLEYTSSVNIGNGKAVQTTRGSYTTNPLSASTNSTLPKPDSSPVTTVETQPKRRFYGSVELDSLRLIGHSQQIADEVLQHLTSLVSANVKVTLEIEAEVTEGIPDNVIRTVRENCKTLKFTSQGFEDG